MQDAFCPPGCPAEASQERGGHGFDSHELRSALGAQVADPRTRYVLQNGAACVTIITEMAASGGLDIDQLAHMDMVDLVRARGVEL